MKPGFLMVLWKKSNPDAEGPLVRQKKILPEELRSQLCHAAMRTTVISPWFDEAVNRGFTNHQVSAEGKEILTYYTTTISVSVFLPHPQYQTPNLRISSGWGCVTPTPAGDISMAITHTHMHTLSLTVTTSPSLPAAGPNSNKLHKVFLGTEGELWFISHWTFTLLRGWAGFPSRCVVSSYLSRKKTRGKKKERL